MTEQVIHATLEDLKRLAESVAWRDVANEVDMWLQEMRDRLEHASDIGEITRCQGIAEACRHFMSLPQNLISALEGNYDGREL